MRPLILPDIAYLPSPNKNHRIELSFDEAHGRAVQWLRDKTSGMVFESYESVLLRSIFSELGMQGLEADPQHLCRLRFIGTVSQRHQDQQPLHFFDSHAESNVEQHLTGWMRCFILPIPELVALIRDKLQKQRNAKSVQIRTGRCHIGARCPTDHFRLA
jgi:hypothetical protein